MGSTILNPPKFLSDKLRHAVFYNPLNRDRSEILSLEVPHANIEILKDGVVIPSQAVLTDQEPHDARNVTATVYFEADLPGLSFSTFEIREHES
jgi:hypothetical protein